MRVFLQCFSIVFIIFLTGCSPITSQPRYSNIEVSVKIDKNLANRFSQYWYYRLHNQYKKSYMFELPYQRYLIPLQEYKGLVGGYGKGAKIILYDAIFPNSRTAIIKKKIVTNKSVLFSKDKWILVDGIWYHKFFQNVLPPKNEEEAEFQ